MQQHQFEFTIQPDEDDPEVAEVLVEGSIDGNAYCFLLDTGAARTTVARDDDTAAFACVGTSSSSGVFSASRDDLIRVPRLAVGTMVREDFTLARRTEATPNVRNVIGMDLLKDYCCHFLFEEKRVSVGAVDRSALAFQELFLDRTFHPYVDIQFGALGAKAVWDTGAGITIADRGFIKQCPEFFQEIGCSYGTDSAGVKMETPLFRMAPTRIGDTLFPAHKVAGVDLSHVNAAIETPMDLILGYSTLRLANWLFDFPGRRWAISRMLTSQAS